MVVDVWQDRIDKDKWITNYICLAETQVKEKEIEQFKQN